MSLDQIRRLRLLRDLQKSPALQSPKPEHKRRTLTNISMTDNLRRLNKNKKYMIEEERNTQIQRNNRLLYEKIVGHFQQLKETMQCRQKWRKKKRPKMITDNETMYSSKIKNPEPINYRSRVQTIRQSKLDEPHTLFLGKAQIDGLMLKIKISLSKQRYLLLANNDQLSIQLEMQYKQYMRLHKGLLQGNPCNIFQHLEIHNKNVRFREKAVKVEKYESVPLRLPKTKTVGAMARRNLKSREKVYMEGYQSEDGFKFDQTRPQRRDYITLKNRSTKTKQENQQELLEYYTTEKFNEYFRELTHVKMTYNSQTIQQIKQMHDMVQAGHNICVFGRGSKIDLLKDIHKKLLTSYNTFEPKGFLPSVTQKKICTHFGGYLLDLGLAKNLEKYAIFDQIEEYHNILNKSKTKIVVILHSIDGPQLMNPDSQEKLSCLFDNPFIQLICSLDSMKMVMNWSPITLQKYKFLFFNVDTRQPYIEQLRYRSLKNENKENTEDSLMYVWQSLNKNQKQIVKFIAANAIQNINKDESQSNYYTFSALLDVCIEQVVLSSDHQLRQNLLQLLDHKIILERTDDKRNKKIYVMKYEKRTLEKVMELRVD